LHRFCRWKSRPKIWATLVNFKKTQSKQPHNGRKFAQSGHPGDCLLWEVIKKLHK
jgi:hypothetical protein